MAPAPSAGRAAPPNEPPAERPSPEGLFPQRFSRLGSKAPALAALPQQCTLETLVFHLSLYWRED
jgi:hypothetical protein